MEDFPTYQGNNPLLIHHEIGKPKKTTMKLPPEDHAFGKVDPKDPEGANQGKSTHRFSDSVMEIPR